MNPEDYFNKFIMMRILDNGLSICGIPTQYKENRWILSACFSMNENSKTISFPSSNGSYIDTSDFEKYYLTFPDIKEQKNVFINLFTYRKLHGN